MDRCQGTSWSEELDDKSLRFPGHRQHGQLILHRVLQVWYYLKWWCSHCTAVMHYSSTSYMYVFLSRSVPSCIRTGDFRKKFVASNPCVAFFALAASVVLPGRVVS